MQFIFFEVKQNKTILSNENESYKQNSKTKYCSLKGRMVILQISQVACNLSFKTLAEKLDFRIFLSGFEISSGDIFLYFVFITPLAQFWLKKIKICCKCYKQPKKLN